MAAAAILDFQKFEILTIGANMRNYVEFRQNRSNGYGDIAI